jgi:phosphoenolpyruvate-protein phosphotransferase (PTS system enzyme I)
VDILNLENQKFRGIGVSNGIAIAKARVIVEETIQVIENHDVTAADELDRLNHAIEQSLSGLTRVFETTKEKLGEDHAQIFEAHMLILQDPEFVSAIQRKITEENVNAEFALEDISGQMVALFEAMENEYMRQRSADIRDVSLRVMNHLQGKTKLSLSEIQEPIILVAHDLNPSDTIDLDKRFVKGVLTNIGGRTSHSSIMARSLGIPAVVGLGNITDQVEDGITVIVNGTDGEVIIQPSQDELKVYESRHATYLKEQQELQQYLHLPSETLDNHRVEIAANIGTPDDLPAVVANGSEGIGLFRSEFLYMNRNDAPSEEEQFEAYKKAAEALQGKPVIVRTLDVGGDKEIPYLDLPKESNPFLGYRAIRVCLDRKELFKVQLRAIVRASHYGTIKIMFPMISNITEVRSAKSILHEVMTELEQAGIPFDKNLEVGIMVEIPSSALAADILAKEVDFFSIGTNDLIQYTMACDRMNQKISYLYQPYNPSILRLIKMVIEGAHQAGKWVGMCGEMAGDKIAVPILLGLGLDEFSMSAGSVLSTRKIIRGLKYEDMKTLANEALNVETQEAVRSLVEERLK